jgi:phosphoethanolamine N-methyltransferase
MTDSQHHDEYDATFVAGLEWMWGEGFLSPGGPAEVAEILRGIDLRGKRVLDIGCGIGGIDILLVQQHGAAHITAIDVEQPLLERAQAVAEQAGVAAAIDFVHVAPGPLPFDDERFDLVFSKDSMIHIPDKQAIYSEIHRVLRTGGQLAFSDWFGSAGPATAELDTWLNIVGLTFRMDTLQQAAELLADIGFSEIDTSDRNHWYRREVRRELESISGERFPRLVEHLGRDAAEQRLRSTTAKSVVVDQGQLRPGHVRARKPVVLSN